MAIAIRVFNKTDQERIRAFVLDIQNHEFGLGFREDEQPDLLDTAQFYANGGFWIATHNDDVVGCIGLQQLNAQNAVLRKMFVKKEMRGSTLNIAGQLLENLLSFAKQKQIHAIWLDTPAVATASHKFYERNGFVQVDKLGLPEGYFFPDKQSKIYRLIL